MCTSIMGAISTSWTVHLWFYRIHKTMLMGDLMASLQKDKFGLPGTLGFGLPTNLTTRQCSLKEQAKEERLAQGLQPGGIWYHLFPSKAANTLFIFFFQSGLMKKNVHIQCGWEQLSTVRNTFLFALTYIFSGQAFVVCPLPQGPSSTDSQFF